MGATAEGVCRAAAPVNRQLMCDVCPLAAVEPQHGVAYSSGVKFIKPTCTNKKHVYVSRAARKHPNNRKLGHVPGYGGTVPHIEQIMGRSFGRVRMRARHAAPPHLCCLCRGAVQRPSFPHFACCVLCMFDVRQASRRAFKKSAIELFVEDSIPPAPQATDRIKVSLSGYARAGGRMPGYTGYMPDAAHR